MCSTPTSRPGSSKTATAACCRAQASIHALASWSPSHSATGGWELTAREPSARRAPPGCREQRDRARSPLASPARRPQRASPPPARGRRRSGRIRQRRPGRPAGARRGTARCGPAVDPAPQPNLRCAPAMMRPRQAPRVRARPVEPRAPAARARALGEPRARGPRARRSCPDAPFDLLTIRSSPIW